MREYILPIILLIISGFVFIQNKKPVLERPVAFDNPWGPLIYIATGLTGAYLLFRIGIKELIIGWFASLIIATIISSFFRRTQGSKN